MSADGRRFRGGLQRARQCQQSNRRSGVVRRAPSDTVRSLSTGNSTASPELSAFGG